MSLTLQAYGNDFALGRAIPALAVDSVEDGAQLTPLLDRAFGPARVTLATSTRLGVTVPAKGRRAETRVLATMAWVDGGCEQLTMTIGRCPESDARGRALGAHRPAAGRHGRPDRDAAGS